MVVFFFLCDLIQITRISSCIIQYTAKLESKESRCVSQICSCCALLCRDIKANPSAPEHPACHQEQLQPPAAPASPHRRPLLCPDRLGPGTLWNIRAGCQDLEVRRIDLNMPSSSFLRKAGCGPPPVTAEPRPGGRTRTLGPGAASPVSRPPGPQLCAARPLSSRCVLCIQGVPCLASVGQRVGRL